MKFLTLLIIFISLNSYSQDIEDINNINDMLRIDDIYDGGDDKSVGVVGSTCWSDPQVFHDGHKVYCFTPPKKFYPGLTAFFGKKAHIRECQVLNALDPAPRGASSTCYKRCSIDTHCLYGDNR